MKDPEYRRRWNQRRMKRLRKRQYGRDQEDYDRMLKAQNGRCKICKRSPDQALCVDHDHKTGEVRGLLCVRCNANLEWAEAYMESIQAYLK
jgi:hypothetical protein